MKSFLDSRVVVTGATGTVGIEIVRQVIAAGAKEVIGLDLNESELYDASVLYQDQPASFALADVRDRRSLDRWMDGADYVLHAAALKHVPVCELVPSEAVRTNIEGTLNVIEAAKDAGVKRVLFTSSDKAVNPTNVMGTSKLMGERLMTSAYAQQRSPQTIFASTRFGNVLGSRGSVVPIFKGQIHSGGPVTVTDTRMSRFIMTLEEAVKLVLESLFRAQGGEVFITRMPVCNIRDLADVMLNLLDPSADPDQRVSVTGARPGEKLYEELMNDEEVRRSYEVQGDFIVVLPALPNRHGLTNYSEVRDRFDLVDRPYNSDVETKLSKDELASYLVDRGVVVPTPVD